MLVGTHLAAAALLARPARLSPAWLVAGAALPDVLDKPLATVGVVETFHSVGHSALLVPLALAVAAVSRAGLAAAVGWGSHLLLDAVHVVLNGRPGSLLSLGWPLTRPPDPLGIPPGEFLLFYLWTPSFYLEAAFWLLALALVARRWRAGDPLLAAPRPPER